MQLDSMSYQILPILAETGLFKEARELYSRLNGFARQAKHETADMIGKSFKNSNYSAGLDMGRFLDSVSNSLQLRVALVELPLMELLLTEKLHTPEAACDYLQQYCDPEESGTPPTKASGVLIMGGSVSVPFTMLTDAEISKLADNGDYSLLVRTDTTPSAETAECAARRAQLERRLSASQLMLRAVVMCLDGEVVEGVRAVGLLRKELQRPSAAESMLWSQSYHASSYPTSHIQDPISLNLWEATLAGFEFALSTATALEAGLGFSPHTDSGTIGDNTSPSPAGVLEVLQSNAIAVQQLTVSCMACMQTLRDPLCSSSYRYLPSPSTHRAPAADQKDKTNVITRPLAPEWIRRVAAFVRIFASTVPILLQAGLISLPSSKRPHSKNGAHRSNRRKSRAPGHENKDAALSVPKCAHSDNVISVTEPLAALSPEEALAKYSRNMESVGDAIKLVTEAVIKLMGR